MKESNHLYTNTDLRKLLVPIIVEQLLSCLMGTVDTMMVSNVGSAAISAVSLVDSINVLVIQALSALAAGGAILCSHYLGNQNEKHATHAARQVLLVMTVLSTALTLMCLFSRTSLLRLIFGKIEADVMTDSQVYFLFTLLSFPFIGLYDAGASVMRAQNDSRHPMIISVISNFLNIGGNAILIFVLHMGVAGAAISTLVSSGIENSMFQFGKLAIQSTVSTLGTIAIAAQAMTNILENLNGVAAIGIGIGLMTVVGQCLGAGRQDEAVYYIKKLCVIAEVIIIISCLGVFALTKPITILGGMEKESADMCFRMMMWITIVKPLVWIMAFIPGYGLRAAGDVKFSMITSCCTMWVCRFCLCVFLIRRLGFGPMGVWIGMFADWTVRSIIFTWRFHSRKWLQHKVI